MDKLEIIKAKELRGEIVKRLYDSYVDTNTLNSVRQMLRYKSYYTPDGIKKAVSYLSGKGKAFIEVALDKEEYWESLVYLTPAGVNLAEKDIADVGVLMDE